MKLNLTVCDICKDKDREAKTYRLQSEGRVASTDRCDEHGAIFEEVLRNAAPAAPAPTRSRRERRNRTTTIEAIEAAKQARKG